MKSYGFPLSFVAMHPLKLLSYSFNFSEIKEFQLILTLLKIQTENSVRAVPFYAKIYNLIVTLSRSLKALLHCAIFSATCLAILENVTLRAAEVLCYTTTRSQQLAIFLAGLGWAWREPRTPQLLEKKNETHARAPSSILP